MVQRDERDARGGGRGRHPCLLYTSFFAAPRARRAELLSDPGYVDQVLREGAERARLVASVVIKRARKAAGIDERP